MDDENLTSANLENNHEFINKEYSPHSIGTRPFKEVKNKVIRAYAQSGEYHTIVESGSFCLYSNFIYLFMRNFQIINKNVLILILF